MADKPDVEDSDSEDEEPHVTWVQKYDKPMPQEIMKLCEQAECHICRKRFHRLEDSETHYGSAKHEKKVEQQLMVIFKDRPGDPLGHCYSTLAPKLKSDQDKDTNFDSVPDERLDAPEDAAAEEKTEDSRGVKRDSRGVEVNTTMSDPAINVNADQNDQRLSDIGVSELEAITEEQPKVIGLQVRRDLVEETLVEELEEGELAHISWVSSYDRPLPQEILMKCFPDECKVCEVNVRGEIFSVKLQSVSTRQQHYSGAKHAKRVRACLEEWSKKNPGEPKPRRVVSSGLLPTISSFVIEQAKNPVEVRRPDVFDWEEEKRKKQGFWGNSNKKDRNGPQF